MVKSTWEATLFAQRTQGPRDGAGQHNVLESGDVRRTKTTSGKSYTTVLIAPVPAQGTLRRNPPIVGEFFLSIGTLCTSTDTGCVPVYCTHYGY